MLADERTIRREEVCKPGDYRGILVPTNAGLGEHRVLIGAYTNDGVLLGAPVALDIQIQ